jgi:hypothetical protein
MRRRLPRPAEFGKVLLQRREGPLRDLPRRGVRLRRIALPAERLCSVSDLQGSPLQRQDGEIHQGHRTS